MSRWSFPFSGMLACALLAAGLGIFPAGASAGPLRSADTPRPASLVPAALETPTHHSLRNSRIVWPTRDRVIRVVTLRDYNTRVVTLGTMLLGICAGVVGTFMLLRRRALVGDVVSHASLPGIAAAFLAAELAASGSGKSLPVLLSGALVAGTLGVLATTAIRRWTRIKEDAALAIVLSVFFGLGIALFTIVQNVPAGNAAGLNHFIFGKAASIVADDVILIAQAAAVVLAICALLFKEFALLCFDEEFAAAEGWPVTPLDLLLMSLVVGVTVIGLQSVGLLLVVALLIIPAAAARFWTHRLGRMTCTAALIGGMSACLGVQVSALFPRLAAGAVIVLAGSACFVVSLLFGARRGVLWRLLLQWQMRRRIARQHVLRAIYEALESTIDPGTRLTPEHLVSTPVALAQLADMRTWSPRALERAVASAQRQGLLRAQAGTVRLTEAGAAEAGRIVRNHRLWELYLMKYADLAPADVDREADAIEHVLDRELVADLEQMLSKRYRTAAVPPSPHHIEIAGPSQ